MFLGHFAVALGAKKVAPKVSLGMLVASATFLDLLWPAFLLLGIEHVRIDPGNTPVTPLDFYDYPLTHSLLGAIGWSVLVGGMYYLIRKERRGSLILGLGVLSHWLLDLITHRPDLPIVPWSQVKVGMGLWYSVPATVIVELGMFLGAFWLYARSTSSRDSTGTWSLYAFAIVLLGLYAANLFGPPPPSAGAIGYAGLGAWLFVLWAFWIDHHRSQNPPQVVLASE